MASAPEETEDGVRRALDAAEAANEAAQDLASLQASYKTFAEAVIRGQRRNTLFAAGAAAGAALALAMGGLVYFRSVSDLRVAAAVQSDAAALLVEELQQIDHIGDAVQEQQDKMRADLLDLLEKVKDEIRRAAMEGDAPAEADPQAEAMTAQMATSIRDGVRTDLEGVRDEVLAALAEMQVAGAGGATAELTSLVAELKALVAMGGTVERADAPAPAPAPASRPAKPKPKPAAVPEANPFTYP